MVESHKDVPRYNRIYTITFLNHMTTTNLNKYLIPIGVDIRLAVSLHGFGLYDYSFKIQMRYMMVVCLR